jgi:hypothetical protein
MSDAMKGAPPAIPEGVNMTDVELARRLERLERDNRRLKGFAVGALVLATALFGIYAAQPVPEKITAHEFDVVDSTGKIRMKMFVHSSGEPAIRLLDAQGKARVAMGVLPSGEPGIALSDAQGKAGAMMEIDSSGEPNIHVFDAQHKERVKINVNSSGEPSIELSDPQGFSMDLGTTGTVNRITGETQRTSAASIVMFGNDKDHKVIWQAP